MKKSRILLLVLLAMLCVTGCRAKYRPSAGTDEFFGGNIFEEKSWI